MKITKTRLKEIIKEELIREAKVATIAEPPRELVRQWETSIIEFIDKQFKLGGDDIAGESPAIVAALENVRRNYSGNNKDFRE